MNTLEFLLLFITGFTSCAEFGSYAFVHPVIRRLPQEQHVLVEKGFAENIWKGNAGIDDIVCSPGYILCASKE